MIYRLTLAAIAAVFFGVAAQSANAALSAGERPLAQEMEHGIAQPSYDGGATTPPSSETEPEAVESVPTPTEQGISTSPGVTPGTEPVDPGTEATSKDEEDTPAGGVDIDKCEAAADTMDAAEDAVAVAGALHEAFGSDVFQQWQENALTTFNDARVDAKNAGCYGDPVKE